MRSPHFKVQEMLAQAGKYGKTAPLAPAELFVHGYLPAQVSSEVGEGVSLFLSACGR